MNRRVVLAVVMALFDFVAFGQIRIEMEDAGGVYKIPCLINGAKMKMIFDTGASSVCVSRSIAQYLLENEYISPDDFTGEGQSVIANGDVVNNLNLIIKDIEIAGLHLTNVDAVVVDGLSAPLLLGMSAISKLGRVELYGNVLSIVDYSSKEANIEDSLNNALQYYEDEFYRAANEEFKVVYDAGVMSDDDKVCYAYSLALSNRVKDAISVMNSIGDIKKVTSEYNAYSLLGSCYHMEGDLESAILYYEKTLSLDSFNTLEQKARINSLLGDVYTQLCEFNRAADYYKASIENIEKEWGIYGSIKLLENHLYKYPNKRYRNEDVDYYCFNYVKSLYYDTQVDGLGCAVAMSLMAKNRNESAKKWMYKNKLSSLEGDFIYPENIHKLYEYLISIKAEDRSEDEFYKDISSPERMESLYTYLVERGIDTKMIGENVCEFSRLLKY